MASTEQGTGWLPVEAVDDLEEKRDRASREQAARLLEAPPRERVLELMRLVAAGPDCEDPLRPEDLARVLESFEGQAIPTEEELAALFPGAVAPKD